MVEFHKMKNWIFIVFSLFILLMPSPVSAEYNLSEGYKQLEDKNYKLALSYLYQASISPDATLADYALYGMGQAYYGLEDYASAAYEFNKVITDYPKSPLQKDAHDYLAKCEEKTSAPSQKVILTTNTYGKKIYTLGRKYGRRGKYVKAINTLSKIPDRYPQSIYAPASLYYLGLYYDAYGSGKSALSCYTQIIVNYPHSDYAMDAILKAGKSYYLKGDFKAALAVYGYAKRLDVDVETPQCLFLWGKLYEKLGSPESAAGIYYDLSKRFDHTYFAYRANERLKDLKYQTPLDAVKTETEEAREKELSRILEEEHREPLALSKKMEEAGKYSKSVRYAEKAVKKAVYSGQANALPYDAWTLAYPKAFWSKVNNYSKEHGIDPYLSLAVIREESRFNPAAKSRSSAYGLMQIIPSTGKILAKQLEIKPFKKKKMYNADLNIKMGTYYLSNLINRFDGNVALALAGYNGGPVRVRKWINEWYSGDIANLDIDDFVQRIPIRETRYYVQKVLGSYYEYKRIYN